MWQSARGAPSFSAPTPQDELRHREELMAEKQKMEQDTQAVTAGGFSQEEIRQFKTHESRTTRLLKDTLQYWFVLSHGASDLSL